MAVVGPLLGLLASAVVTYVMPKKYESTAVVQVNSRSWGNLNSDGLTSRFFGTQFEVIKSRKVLQRAVGALDLTKRWGVDDAEAIQMLKNIVQTQNIRGTELIAIRVCYTNAEDTRDIALEVAKAYRDRRAELENDRARQMLEKLDDALREQEKRVEEKRQALNKLVEENEGSPSTARHLDAARQDSEDARETLDEMRMETATDRISRELPRNPIVIHEEPILARRPSSPNVPLNLVAGLVAGLPLGLLLALPMMWMADRLSRSGRPHA